MATQNPKTSEFFNAINEDLRKQVSDIMNDADRLKSDQLARANADAKKQSAEFLRNEVAKITQSTGRRIAAAEAETKREKFDKRSSIAKQVFDRAADKLKAFSATPEYEKFLVESAQSIADEFNGGEILFSLRSADMKFGEKIAAAVVQQCRFEADDTIELGGCKAVSESSRLTADDTLDSRLKAQLGWFYENSGLSV